ncbi:MAG: site-2 protease family protein [Deltaproteobacteria bacterium]|nr:site-2 protease family protein [Deltaproteobacteria bacterium]
MLPAEPADAQELREVQEALLQKPKAASPVFAFLVSLVVFTLASSREGNSVRDLVIMIAVLLVHELGHLAAMRFLGYTDLSVFFIPFLGAAASGRKRGAPGWQQAVVALAGPVPGILLAGVLVVAGLRNPSSELHEVASWLLIVNGFNLLPVYPLDGARLFEFTLFSRHPLLETGFRTLTVLILVLLALAAQAWIMGLFAVLILFGIPKGHRESRAAHELRTADSATPPEPQMLDEARLRALLHKARAMAQVSGPDAKGQFGQVVRSLYDRVLRRPPGALASVLFLVLWFSSVSFAIGAGVLNGFVEERTQADAVLMAASGHFERGDYAKASSTLDQCRVFELGSASKYQRLRCQTVLGEALVSEGRYQEAVQVLSKAIGSRAAARSFMRQELRRALLALAAAKEALDEEEAAERLRARAQAMAEDSPGTRSAGDDLARP